MTTISIALGVILILALFAREFNWRTQAIILVTLVGMIVMLIR